MNHWWVNHKKTWEQEVNGGYLWSPKTEKSGRNSEFYNNMRRALPGDTVFSFAYAKIKRIGVVADYAFTAPIPKDFIESNDNWAHVGWRLPISWVEHDLSFEPKEHIEHIRGWLAPKYSPISIETGYGNQKAYFSKIDERLYRYILAETGCSERVLGILNFDADQVCGKQAVDDEVQASLEEDQSITETERLELRKARRGQGKFRKNVKDFENRCRITGVEFDGMLIASHIKPWALCSTHKERLDGENGLMLAPHIDRLFDRGFISFEKDGTVIVSPLLPAGVAAKIGLPKLAGLQCGRFSPKQNEYLRFHQENVFIAGS